MDEFTVRRAAKLLERGLAAVSDGNWKQARELFEASSSALPSADSLTYWGWMEHHLGNTVLAIDLCKRAIKMDPEFGNPYNDIGSYLMAQGKEDEAIPWFQQAVQAKRYEPRQFPHLNLGRVYLMKDMPSRALEEFRKALAFAPEDPDIMEMIEQIEISLN